jgi:gas vesicle protein
MYPQGGIAAGAFAVGRFRPSSGEQMSNSEQNKIKEELDQLMEELTALADQVQLKLHLGGMDAQDAWRRLEPQLSELKERVSSASGALAQEAKKSAADVKAELHDLGALLGLTK